MLREYVSDRHTGNLTSKLVTISCLITSVRVKKCMFFFPLFFLSRLFTLITKVPNIFAAIKLHQCLITL